MLTQEPEGPIIGASLFAKACMKFKATGKRYDDLLEVIRQGIYGGK